MKYGVVASCTAFALFCARPIVAQQASRAADSIRAAAFDRLDRTAQTLLYTTNCARNTARARELGLFGPPDSVGRRGQCLRVGGRSYGVFLDADSTFTTARQLRVVDFEKQVRYLEPVDTAAILAEARASDEAVMKGFSSFQNAKRPFAPLSFRSDGDSIEVWLVPAGSLLAVPAATVGGERGYIYSPNGRTLVREIDAFDRFRPLAIPDSGAVNIRSQEDDLPLVSELIVANRLYARGRPVAISTKAYTSALAGTDPNSAVWIQLKKR